MKPANYWTETKLIEEASSYKHRIDFKKGSTGAYSAARRMKILDVVCAHMTKSKNSCKKWFKDNVAIEAKKYKSRSEFRLNANGAYNAARIDGYLDNVCHHMVSPVKISAYPNIESVRNEARKYQTRTEFYKSSSGAYDIARRNSWLDDICEHMTSPIKPMGYWTKENVLVEAKKFKHRNDFHKKSSSAYSIARNNSWLEEACQHMEVQGHRYKRKIYKIFFEDGSMYIGLSKDPEKREKEHISKGTKAGIKMKVMPYTFVIGDNWLSAEESAEVEKNEISKAKSRNVELLNVQIGGGLGAGYVEYSKHDLVDLTNKYTDLKDFIENENGAYQVILKRQLKDELLSHLIRKIVHTSWTTELIGIEARKYNYRTDFKYGSPNAYAAAQKRKLLNEVCSHMKVKSNQKWTEETVINEALKYKTRKDFKHKSAGAYGAARQLGLLQNVCTHMDKIIVKKQIWKWTVEALSEEAKKFESKAEFRKKSNSAYATAQKRGLLQTICEHME